MKMNLLALAVPILFSASVAQADEATYVVGPQDDYTVDFFVDDLNADGINSTSAQITVRPPSARSILIRPRTSFVMEMLKSVENL